MVDLLLGMYLRELRQALHFLGSALLGIGH